VVWRGLWAPSLEWLALRRTSAGWRAQGTVIAAPPSGPWRLRYAIELDPAWETRAFRAALEEPGARRAVQMSRRPGEDWCDGEGRPLEGFAGCVDVDIAATPFTNTLPVRRLDWRDGQPVTLRMVYVQVPALEVRPAAQRYTRRAHGAAGSRFLYEGLDTDFRAEITLDGDGLVVDYPETWERVQPPG
jgi:hypothetical protein